MSVEEELSKIRELNLADLKVHLITLLKEQFDLRMQHRSGQLTNNSQLNKVKKAIARVKTVINEKAIVLKN